MNILSYFLITLNFQVLLGMTYKNKFISAGIYAENIGEANIIRGALKIDFSVSISNFSNVNLLKNATNFLKKGIKVPQLKVDFALKRQINETFLEDSSSNVEDLLEQHHIKKEVMKIIKELESNIPHKMVSTGD